MALFIPEGFTPPLDVETGIAPNTVPGRIDAAEAITEFYYTKTLFLDTGEGNRTVRNTWTFQVLENNTATARVLFEQSVDMGIQLYGGGGTSGWYPITDDGVSVGKFKTRIVNAQFVTQVVENVAGQNPVATLATPKIPGYPFLWNLKQSTINVTLPPLPAGAKSLVLFVAASATAPGVNLTSLLSGAGAAGTVFPLVNVSALTGVSDPSAMWFWVEAVQSDFTPNIPGPKVRDAPVSIQGTGINAAQVSGYEGWRFVDNGNSTPTFFSEQSIDIDPPGGETVFSGQVSATWESCIYKCSLPPNAIFNIAHDDWVSAIVIANKFTFSMGVKYGNDVMAWSPLTQEIWALYRGASGTVAPMLCARAMKPTTFKLLPDTDGQLQFADKGSNIDRAWLMVHQSWVFAFAQQGNNFVGCYSNDKGRTWENAVSILDNTQVMGMVGNDDSSIVWLYGNQAGVTYRVVLKLTSEVPSTSVGGTPQSPTSQRIWQATTQEAITATDPANPPSWTQAPFGITRPNGNDGLCFVWFKVANSMECWLTTDYFRVWTAVALESN